jgi:hypothetical protein
MVLVGNTWIFGIDGRKNGNTASENMKSIGNCIDIPIMNIRSNEI